MDHVMIPSIRELILKIFVTQLIPQAGLDILHRAYPDYRINSEERVLTRPELLENVKGAKALLSLLTDKIDAEVLDAAGPQLKIVANMAAGYDNVDLKAATHRGVMVTNTPGVLTDATSDHAWALLFAIARRVPESENYLRAGRFKSWGPLLFLGGDVTGRTLGIIGAGRIGCAMAMKSRGFDMKVLYANRSPKPELESEMGARKVSVEELLRESDFVSLHIDEAALADALKNGVIAGAALDVFEHEPVVHHDLMKLENVVLTPHTASATIPSRSKMARMAAENLIAGLSGTKPPNLVNTEIWK
jgi:glyoxylate reductase